jgi:hypothetical protein
LTGPSEAIIPIALTVAIALTGPIALTVAIALTGPTAAAPIAPRVPLRAPGGAVLAVRERGPPGRKAAGTKTARVTAWARRLSASGA